MSGSRPWEEIRADFPDCPNDDHHALLDEIEAWLDGPQTEPARGWDGFYQAVIGLLVDLNGAGANLNSLLSEWKSGNTASPGVRRAIQGEFAVAKGLVADAKPPAERASSILKARNAALWQANRDGNKERRWQAAPASVQAIRQIDLALEGWRDDSEVDAIALGEILKEISDIVDAFYGPGQPDPPTDDDAMVRSST